MRPDPSVDGPAEGSRRRLIGARAQAETKEKAERILAQKRRNLSRAQDEQALKQNRARTVGGKTSAVAEKRRDEKRAAAAARARLTKRRQDDAREAREDLAARHAASDGTVDARFLENRAKNETRRKEQAAETRRRERLRSAAEREARAAYARRVDEETARAAAAERRIAAMAAEEQKLIEQLRSTQDRQRRAYEDLQETLQVELH